jgi:hypothetical protein
VESPRPFCIQFGVRPNFSKRLANLAAGAAEGKGLSELISLAEHSNSTGDSLKDAENHKHGDDAITEDHERQDLDDLEGEAEGGGEISEIPQALVVDTDVKSPKPATRSLDKTTTEQNDASTTQLSPKPEKSQSVNRHETDNYDEEDLIDYSDEEEQAPEKSVEAAQREVRQEPVPNSANDDLPEQSAATLEVAEVEDDGQDGEAAIEGGIEYDEDNDESYYLETEARENGHDASETNDAAETWEDEGNSQLAAFQNGVKSIGKSQDVESDHGNLEDEIEYDDNDAEVQALTKLSDEDLGLDAPPENSLEDAHAASLAIGEETENGTSGEPLDASAIPDEASEDEIDYDDDDDLVVPGVEEPLSDTKEVLAALDGSGKRQREDANLDEGTSTGGQGACYIIPSLQKNVLTGPTEVKRRKS